MDSFGATLKKEREEAGLTLDTVAAVIKIDRESLEALERNEFAGLPEHEVMLQGLRAYADCLQVDAELMIESYEQERERSLQRLADRVAERVDETMSVDVPSSTAQPRRRLPKSLVVSAFGVLLVALAAWWMFKGEGTVEPPPAPISNERVAPRPAGAALVPSTSPRTTPAEPRPAPAIRVAIPATGPGVPEYGVGTGVRNRELVGRSDRFAAGTQAWFWTRVEGGKPGDRIHHVWLHEGVEAARITLSIGGSRWRTQSAKTLRSAGAWAVEARDAAGRVLARTEFDCVR